MISLLQIATKTLGWELCWGSHALSLELIPESQLALGVWHAWQVCLKEACWHPTAPQALAPPPLARQQEVLAAFAAAYWRPRLLRLSYASSMPAGMSSLKLVVDQLQHLELSVPMLTHLGPVASACRHLRCLSLRGCLALTDASLAVVSDGLTALQALDLGNLSSLTDAACYHIARLPSLAALNLSGTSVGDGALELLTYGHKVRAWQRSQGLQTLPASAAAWAAPPLEHLQLAGTRVGPAGMSELAHLPGLRFLDMRGTGITRASLGPLQRRFALEFVQAAVLSSSSTVAAAVVNQDAVVCRCGLGAHCSSKHGAAKGGVAAELRSWEEAGVRLLLHADPAGGVRSYIADALQEPECPDGSQVAAMQHWPGQARRVGYRQSRQPPLPGAVHGPPVKRKWTAL